MTSKEFIIVADAIGFMDNEEEQEIVLTFFLGIVKQLNPNFDKDKFISHINMIKLKSLDKSLRPC